MTQNLENYQTTSEDLGLIINAVKTHHSNLDIRPKIPENNSLRIKNQLFIVIDTCQKILLLPPGLPKESYAGSTNVVNHPDWKMIPIMFSQQDFDKWLKPNKAGQYKLGNYSAWDNDLNLCNGAPEWQAVVAQLSDLAVWNPMQTTEDPNRTKTIPASVYSAPTYRKLKRLKAGINVPIIPELIVAMAHEGGSHINIMGKVQSWPDNHGGDNSLIEGPQSLTKLINKYSLELSAYINETIDTMIRMGIAPIAYIHELLAYLTEVVETGISIDNMYLHTATQFLQDRNYFGAKFADETTRQLSLEECARFGNELVDQLIRDR